MVEWVIPYSGRRALLRIEECIAIFAIKGVLASEQGRARGGLVETRGY